MHLRERIVKRTRRAFAICFALTLVVMLTTKHASAAESLWRVADRIDIETVPSWFPVEFSLLTHGQRQYVAFYDAKH